MCELESHLRNFVINRESRSEFKEEVDKALTEFSNELVIE